MTNQISFRLRLALAFSLCAGAIGAGLIPMWLHQICCEISKEGVGLSWLIMVGPTAITTWVAWDITKLNLWGATWPIKLHLYLLPFSLLPLFIQDINLAVKLGSFFIQAFLLVSAWRCHIWLRAVAAEEFDHLWPEYRAQKAREKAAKERLKHRRRGLRK